MREGRIEEGEFWRKEEGEKFGTKLLEMEAKKPAISAITIGMLLKTAKCLMMGHAHWYKYSTSILEDPYHQITECHKCNLYPPQESINKSCKGAHSSYISGSHSESQ